MKDKRAHIKQNYANPYLHKPLPMSQHIREAGFVEKQVKLSHITMNYVEGPKNGPPLVLVPAQMGTWQSYYKVLPILAKQFWSLLLMFADMGAVAGHLAIIPGIL